VSARDLRELAKALGVQASFTDTMGTRRTADPESLLAVVRALGEDLGSPDDATDALRRVREERSARLVEPVVIAWDGRFAPIALAGRVNRRVDVRLELEDGGELATRVTTRATGDATSEIELGLEVPFGVHRLVIAPGGRRREGEATVLSAPTRIAPRTRERDWGVSLPLHALVTERSWGIGDLTGLAELADWVRSVGGGVVATLPLLAGFPDEASPYSPASRLFWNERYVDVEALADGDAATRRLIRSARFARELERVRSAEVVDHAAVMRLKRDALERLAASRGDDPDVRRFVRERPDVEDYARFRAAGEAWGLDWRSWRGRARDGVLSSRALDARAIAYHRFAQFAAERQVAELGRRSRDAGAGLYLDMPLGTHPDGFDVWRYRDDFADGVSVGAPPDDFFRAGQDWGFPPVHPLRAREHGYAYVRACLRHVFRHAGVVRVDHVIGLHRQYWVPHGMPADRGAFVRYPADEWYAAISLEAERTGTVVVGEDLGTVPEQVHTGMRRHAMLRSYVVQYEATPDRDRVPEPPRASLASLNTHDMPTFAAFWRGADIEDRIVDGLLDPRERDTERSTRDRIRRAILATLGRPEGEDDELEVLGALLERLAASDARFVIVTLEDLWGELRPVNVPGITTRPNWRGRAARSLEQLRASDDVLEVLKRVDAARGAKRRREAA
jgi:4-alpha-glucanotransferase